MSGAYFYTPKTGPGEGDVLFLQLSGAKLTPKVKKAWVGALRSGNYDQIEGYLRLGNGYCCLGVLCDLGSGKWRKPTEAESKGEGLPHDAKIYCPVGGFGDLPHDKGLDGRITLERGTYPPPTVVEKSGINKDDMSALTSLNDAGCSFDEIADFIEEHF